MPPIIQSAGQLETIEGEASQWGRSIDRGGLRLYNSEVHGYGTIIRHQPNVRTVISFLARNIAQLGVHTFERVSQTDRERVDDHPFVEALKRPNPADRRLTTYRLMHRTVWDVAAYDVAFWGLLDTPAVTAAIGRPLIVPLNPERLRIKGALWPTGYEYHGRRGVLEFRPDQVVHFQGSHNLDDELWGLPPIEALRRIISEDQAAGEFREQFWSRGARFSGVVERPATAPPWSETARNRFIADLRNAWSGRGSDAGGTPLFEDGMVFRQTENADARSAQYVEARKLSREEAAALWHVDPIWVGIAEAGTSFASVKERHKALYQDTLGPWVVMLEQDLTSQALPAFEPDPTRIADLYVKLNIAEKLRGSLEDQAASLSTATGRPWLTVNEARALVERNDLEGGDGLAVPLNIAIVDGDAPAQLPAPEPDEDDATVTELPAAASRRRGSKAVGPTTDQHQAIATEQVAATTAALARTFARQLADVLSNLGAADDVTLGDLWDADRWDAELATDLLGLSLDTAVAYGELTAEALGFDGLDTDAWLPYLSESAGIAAVNINGTTADQLAAALDDDDPGGAIRNLFALAAAGRAAQIAQTRFTNTAAFAAQDTARQAGRGSKVWLVTSSNSRHPELDGETAPIGEPFSNGMAWPGDPVGGADATAGCTCALGFE